MQKHLSLSLNCSNAFFGLLLLWGHTTVTVGHAFGTSYFPALNLAHCGEVIISPVSESHVSGFYPPSLLQLGINDVHGNNSFLYHNILMR